MENKWIDWRETESLTIFSNNLLIIRPLDRIIINLDSVWFCETIPSERKSIAPILIVEHCLQLRLGYLTFSFFTFLAFLLGQNLIDLTYLEVNHLQFFVTSSLIDLEPITFMFSNCAHEIIDFIHLFEPFVMEIKVLALIPFVGISLVNLQEIYIIVQYDSFDWRFFSVDDRFIRILFQVLLDLCILNLIIWGASIDTIIEILLSSLMFSANFTTDSSHISSHFLLLL